MSENPTLRERFAKFKASTEAQLAALRSERKQSGKAEHHAGNEEHLLRWLGRCLEALPAAWRIAADTHVLRGPETDPVYANNFYSSDAQPAVFLARRFVADFGPTGIGGLTAVEPYWPEEMVDDMAAAKAAFIASRTRDAINRFDRHWWFGPAEAAIRYPCGCGSRSWLLTGETYDSDYDCVYHGQVSVLLCLECGRVDPVGNVNFYHGYGGYWLSESSFEVQLLKHAR